MSSLLHSLPARGRLSMLVLLVSTFCCLTGCERAPAVKIPDAPKVEQLVLVTPHSEMIRTAFADAFSEWHHEGYGSYVQVRWVAAGTPLCVQYVQEAGRPDFVPAGRPIPDVMFGGGSMEHQLLADLGLSQPVDLGELEAELPAAIQGIATRDAENRWHSSALSAFGILIGRQACLERGIEEPQTWEDLADPRYFGWLSIADPQRSGSNRQCLSMILQKYGWEEGWGIIMRIAANCRAMADSSSQVVSSVSTGSCLAGFCVNFTALRRIEQRGAGVLNFVVPSDAGAITPDPVSVLTYALHPKIGEHFARFCVSDAGQELWGVRAEHRGGHDNTLFRYPINPTFYTEHADRLGVPDNPFELTTIFPLDQVLERKQSQVLGPMLNAACGDNHILLQRCWEKIIRSGMSPAALAELTKPIVGAEEAFELGASAQGDTEATAALLKDWSARFREKYERVEGMLNG
ncbi:MAG: solute-binding protein [bacterium]|nr:solute-binding protein [bacterium]